MPLIQCQGSKTVLLHSATSILQGSFFWAPWLSWELPRILFLFNFPFQWGCSIFTSHSHEKPNVTESLREASLKIIWGSFYGCPRQQGQIFLQRAFPGLSHPWLSNRNSLYTLFWNASTQPGHTQKAPCKEGPAFIGLFLNA